MIFIEDRAEFIAQQNSLLCRGMNRDSSRSKIDFRFSKSSSSSYNLLYNLLFRRYTVRWIIRIKWKWEKKKEELRAIDNYRWPLPYILFILQDSCTFVSVEFAYTNRYPDCLSLSLSLRTHHLAVCCVSRPSSKGEERTRGWIHESACVLLRACRWRRAAPSPPPSISFLLRETIGYSYIPGSRRLKNDKSITFGSSS